MPKAFDRAWHEGLFYKLKRNGIDGSFLCLLESFLTDKQQRVVLDGQSSNWKNVRAGVPKGSILGPFLFLIYNIDLPQDLRIDVKLFATALSIFSVVDNIASKLNKDLIMIHD